jgi:hypothetical protein
MMNIPSAELFSKLDYCGGAPGAPLIPDRRR